jgi:uncharacterized protein (TIGR02452 family)
MDSRNIMDYVERLRAHCTTQYTHKQPTLKLTNSVNIIVENMDVLDVARKFDNPLILILADDKRPGGTWISGLQEESLFRRTALFSHLTEDFYPLQDDEVLLAREVAVFSLKDECSLKSFVPIGYLDFIACAGVKQMSKNDTELIQKLTIKIKTILDTAIQYKYKNVVLGALGIGGFSCDPKAVARCFKSVIYEYNKQEFDTIAFAILGNKSEIFRDILLS